MPIYFANLNQKYTIPATASAMSISIRLRLLLAAAAIRSAPIQSSHLGEEFCHQYSATGPGQLV